MLFHMHMQMHACENISHAGGGGEVFWHITDQIITPGVLNDCSLSMHLRNPLSLQQFKEEERTAYYTLHSKMYIHFRHIQ